MALYDSGVRISVESENEWRILGQNNEFISQVLIQWITACSEIFTLRNIFLSFQRLIVIFFLFCQRFNWRWKSIDNVFKLTKTVIDNESWLIMKVNWWEKSIYKQSQLMRNLTHFSTFQSTFIANRLSSLVNRLSSLVNQLSSLVHQLSMSVDFPGLSINCVFNLTYRDFQDFLSFLILHKVYATNTERGNSLDFKQIQWHNIKRQIILILNMNEHIVSVYWKSDSPLCPIFVK